MPIVYLNGDYLPVEEAKISPLDRGFLFGDGIYEVIPVYHGLTFRLSEHLLRLQNSLDGVRIRNPHNNHKWSEIFETLISHNGSGNLSLYLQVTRGVAPRDHAFPDNTTPTVFAMCNPIHPISNKIKQSGVSAVCLEDIRWDQCHLKTIALLPNVLMRQEAMDQGAAEAILIREGIAYEGAASNLFMIKNGELFTPPKGPFLLPGVTRDLVLELAIANKMTTFEKDIKAKTLFEADELWLTSSTKEILPITTLDGQSIGDGKPGHIWEKMIKIYQNYKKSLKLNANV